jgi:hypothetical protein
MDEVGVLSCWLPREAFERMQAEVTRDMGSLIFEKLGAKWTVIPTK